MRFKIDIYRSYTNYFGLYVRRPGGWIRQDTWEVLESFPTREGAMAFYEKIKDLPEYLQ